MILETPLREPLRMYLDAELQLKLGSKFTFGDALALKSAYFAMGSGT
jgi:hypothetical protein